MSARDGQHEIARARAANARRRIAMRGASPDDFKMMRRMRRIAEDNGFTILPLGEGLVGFKVIPAPPPEDDGVSSG